MQGGGGGGNNNGIVELARKAAALARTDSAARVAAMLRPARSYRGVTRRKNSHGYYSVIWNAGRERLLWLGSYGTPEEAAYAYDAAARAMRGHRATTNFPEPACWEPVAPAPEHEVVSTDLVLALPTPAHAVPALRDDPAAAVAGQASFDDWAWVSTSAAAQPQQHQQAAPAPAVFPQQQQQQQRAVPLMAPFTQFFHLADPATAAATANGAAAVDNPSHSNPGVSSSQFFPFAAAPTQHRELPLLQKTFSYLFLNYNSNDKVDFNNQ